MSAFRTGLWLFLDSPGLPERFFAAAETALAMERRVFGAKQNAVLRLSPATGEAGAGIAQHVPRRNGGDAWQTSPA